jgi:hypothetical protein
MFIVSGRFVCVMVMLVLFTAPAGSRAKSMPDTVDLGSLENLYGKVKFDHSKHVSIAGDCAVCHHQATGTPVRDANCARCHKKSGAGSVVACKGCHSAHPFSATAMREKSKSAYHIDQLGLKGAYHQNCTGCHQKMGGPTGCQDCHALKKAGDAFYKIDVNDPGKTP